MTNSLWQQAGMSELQVEQLQQQVQDKLEESLYWFPVRHHSPHCAYVLRQTLLERRPQQIFIEAPQQCQDLLAFIVDSETQPPIALYSSFTDSDNSLGLAGIETPSESIMPSLGSWYPLLEYSPEYVAMKTAQEIGAEVIFIDLPSHARLSFTTPDRENNFVSGDVDYELQKIIGSQFYKLLLQAGHYHNWNECWDALFESPAAMQAESLQEWRYQLTCFCAAVRLTTQIDDETLQREQFMWQQIQRKLNKAEDAIVVCGGLHLFMSQHENKTVVPTEFGEEYHTLVPFSYRRLAEQGGYSAGNRAPYFYQQQWRALNSQQSAHQLLFQQVQYLINYARNKGELLSSSDALASSQHALMLCQLRNREQPILDDIVDAIITCCCKGDPLHEGKSLIHALGEALIGLQYGQVSPAVGQLPLQTDFYHQLEIHDLHPDNGCIKYIKLDKRKVEDQKKSVLLHRLYYLELPFFELREVPQEYGLIFMEQWRCEIKTGVEERLLELSPYGDSIQAVVLNRLTQELSIVSTSMQKITEILLHSFSMELPQVVMHAHKLCPQALADDLHFVSLAQAVANLQLLKNQLQGVSFKFTALEPLIEQCFLRACHALRGVTTVPAEHEGQIVQCLLLMTQSYVSDEWPGLDRGCFIDHLEQSADISPIAFLRGCFWGALLQIRQRDSHLLAQEISSFRFSSAEKMIECSQFVNGVIALSQTSILLGAKEIVQSLDLLLEHAADDVFDIMVVHFRSAFMLLGSAQRMRLADVVAQHYGLREAEDLQLNTSLQSVQVFAELDQQVASIMRNWQCFNDEGIA